MWICLKRWKCIILYWMSIMIHMHQMYLHMYFTVLNTDSDNLRYCMGCYSTLQDLWLKHSKHIIMNYKSLNCSLFFIIITIYVIVKYNLVLLSEVFIIWSLRQRTVKVTYWWKKMERNIFLLGSRRQTCVPYLFSTSGCSKRVQYQTTLWDPHREVQWVHRAT